MDTQEILKKVLRIEIRTRRLVNSILSGEYHSAFRGQGMEFAEVREYSPGDDVRSIDWNVTARMGRPFVKLFNEERELTVMLMVDASSSAEFGTIKRMKHEIAVEICALLAFSAIKNNDQIGLIIFTDVVETFIPPKKGRRHVLRVIRELLWHYEGMASRKNGAESGTKDVSQASQTARFRKPASVLFSTGLTAATAWAVAGGIATGMAGVAILLGVTIAAVTAAGWWGFRDGEGAKAAGMGTDIRGALDYLNRVVRRRGVVFLISDFMDETDDYARALQIANRKHDLIAITITDPAEVSLPKVGLIELEDAETGERIVVDTSSRRIRKEVFGLQDQRRLSRQNLFRSTGVDSIDISTKDEPQDQPYIKPLMRFFESRANRV